MHVLGRKGTPTIQVTISAGQSAYNLFTGAGSPSYKCNVVLTINAGIVVQGTTASSLPAIRTAGFAAGSTLKIINNGIIAGFGGVGGRGARYISAGNNVIATVGSPGGNALDVQLPLTVDNTNGYIFGGGGGGGGSGGDLDVYGDVRYGGGSGGGGCGYNNAAGGTSSAGYLSTGSAGGAGSSSAGGARGTNADLPGKYGGAGRMWGLAGETGTTVGASSGKAGGAAGAAIALNGYTITWSGGNNSTQVKGSVS